MTSMSSRCRASVLRSRFSVSSLANASSSQRGRDAAAAAARSWAISQTWRRSRQDWRRRAMNSAISLGIPALCARAPAPVVARPPAGRCPDRAYAGLRDRPGIGFLSIIFSEGYAVDIAPAPVLAGLHRAHDRMARCAEVPRGVAVLRAVAAAHVAARQAHSEVD